MANQTMLHAEDAYAEVLSTFRHLKNLDAAEGFVHLYDRLTKALAQFKRDRDAYALRLATVKPKPEAPKKLGRQTVWTEERTRQLLDYVRLGVPYVFAYRAVGIAEPTFYKKKAEDLEFREALEKAEADAVARNVGIVQKAAQRTWQAAAWWLERRYAEMFGRRFDVAFRKPEDESTFDEETAMKVAKAFVKRRDEDRDTIH
jgi:hypothetical protein